MIFGLTLMGADFVGLGRVKKKRSLTIGIGAPG